MKPETACSGPSPVWSTHGARRPWARSEANVAVVQSRHVDERVPRELEQPATTEAPQRLLPEREPGPRPELGAEHAEAEVGVGHEALELPLPGGAVAGCEALELGDVLLERRPEEHRLAVGEGRRRSDGPC